MREGANGLGRDHVQARTGTLLYYPPRRVADGGVTGRGRVLVCSNLHWLADEEHWNGGLYLEGMNLPLLHNFVTSAVAARVRLLD